MDEAWLVGISATAGAGLGVLGTILTNLFLLGRRRAETVYQTVQAQRIIIEDLYEAYERVSRRSALEEWSEAPRQ